ncbi:DUF397 domain-containing protein [Kitasatospora sp. NPDC004614]|uniref:DUF397 domain-containing protein n=1 Tax=unclassified Kitasatospora TaxID=2633591 RepID=UPI003691F687
MQNDLDPPGATWRKSSYSNGGGGCVEFDTSHYGAVRDSKDPDGPRLRFSVETLERFVQAVVDGEFGDV